MSKPLRYFLSKCLFFFFMLSVAVGSTAQTVYNFVERTPGGGSKLGGWVTYFQNEGQGFIGNYSVSGYYASAFVHPLISFSESGAALGSAYWRSTLYSSQVHEVGFTFDRTAISSNAFWVNVPTAYSRLTGCISWPGPCGSWTDSGQDLRLERAIEPTSQQLANRLLAAGGSDSAAAALARSLKGYGEAKSLLVAAAECASGFNTEIDCAQMNAEGMSKALHWGFDTGQVASVIIGSTWSARVASLSSLADNVVYANLAIAPYIDRASFVSKLKSNIGSSIDFFREYMSTGGGLVNSTSRSLSNALSFSDLVSLDDLDLTFQRDVNRLGGWDYVSGTLSLKGSVAAFAGLKIGDTLLDDPISGSDAPSFGVFKVSSIEQMADGTVTAVLGWAHAEMATAVPNPSSGLLMLAGLALLSFRTRIGRSRKLQ